MVNLTRWLLGEWDPSKWTKNMSVYFGRPMKKPDKAFGRRRLFLQTALYYGRARNCFRVAARKNMIYKQKLYLLQRAARKDFNALQFQRIEAGAKELNFDGWEMRQALTRAHVSGLNDEILANMAIYEPRTFRAVTNIAAHKAMQPLERGGLGMEGRMGTGAYVSDRI